MVLSNLTIALAAGALLSAVLPAWPQAAAGLAPFLAPQVPYLRAFKPLPGHPISPATFLPFILFGLLMFFLLAPKLGPMKLPVLIYIAAVTTMAGIAAGR